MRKLTACSVGEMAKNLSKISGHNIAVIRQRENKKPINKKPNLAQKLQANPGFKWWAVPPKKGPLSQGLKLPPKQVKKA